MSKLIKPEGYKALLDMKHTEQGIKQIKDFFQQNLSTELRLIHTHMVWNLTDNHGQIQMLQWIG